MGCRGVRMEIQKVGSARCACCNHPRHDELLELYLRGEATADEVGRELGVLGPSFTMHLRRHVPNLEALRVQARLEGEDGMESQRAMLLAELQSARDPDDRLHLLKMVVGLLRLEIEMMVRVRDSSPAHVSAVERLVSRVDITTRSMAEERRQRELHGIQLESASKGGGWEELEAFMEELRAILRDDFPDAYWAILDRHRAFESGSGAPEVG